jgi:hypothetical protein
MLVHTERAQNAEECIRSPNKFNEAAEQIRKGINPPPKAPVFAAEDVVRGWRIDIWDDKTRKWHSLCRRSAVYDINDGEEIVAIDEEEGSVSLAATRSPDPASNPDIIWLHEALISWTGWSLCARPPGMTIHHDRTDHTDPVGEPDAVIPPGIRLKSEFKAIPGSLPRLRYGRRYWLRARVTDLAGNSLPVSEKNFGSEKPAQNARTYLRYEPILAPALALVKPNAATVKAPHEGESMERMAVRTFNENPPDNLIPTTQVAERFVVPSRTSVRDAEQHGMLDQNGIVDPAFFAVLASQDNSLAKETILSEGPLSESSPVETEYAVMRQGLVADISRNRWSNCCRPYL